MELTIEDLPGNLKNGNLTSSMVKSVSVAILTVNMEVLPRETVILNAGLSSLRHQLMFESLDIFQHLILFVNVKLKFKV